MSAPADSEAEIRFEGGRLKIGRNRSNDVVVDDERVAGFHAELVRVGDVIELRRLQPGHPVTCRGREVSRAVIRDGDQFSVGGVPMRLTAPGAAPGAGPGRLEADRLTVNADGRPILDRVSVAIEPGELVCVIGESGSGKTTLLLRLAGIKPPTSGTARVGGAPAHELESGVGYVPQDEIVHRRLTVREALDYAARLRLPRERTAREREATVERVLAELSLSEHAAKRIGDLSGGQRKRVGVASELLSRPGLLFLDEPTTGLDPGLEAQAMRLFRELAHPGERTVVLVTHATASLALADRLVVLGRGGKLTFSGPPAEALEFFGTETYDGIYAALLDGEAAEWARRFAERRTSAGSATGGAGGAGKPPSRKRPAGPGSGAQLGALLGRYVKLFARDRRNLAILFGQVPILALATALLFSSGLFDRSAVPGEADGDPRYAIQLLFILSTTAIWFGAISSVREIVKERAVIEREAAVGVGWGAYLASKLGLLAGVVVVQVVLLSFFVLAIHPLDSTAATYLTVIGLLIVTAVSSVGLGLLISASVGTEEQATSLLPLALIPQLLLAGAVVPVERMSGLIEALSFVSPSRWSLAGLGNAVDMNARIGTDPVLSQSGDFGTSFFSLLPGAASVILLAFAGGFLLATLMQLARE